MAKKQTLRKKYRELTLHGLLGSLSYWGSMARLLLVGILVMVAFFLNITAIDSSSFVYHEVLVLLYSFALLLVLDTGYVMTARGLPLRPRVDRWILLGADLVVASFFVIPSFFYVSDSYGMTLRIISPAIVLAILTIRLLVGLLFKRGK